MSDMPNIVILGLKPGRVKGFIIAKLYATNMYITYTFEGYHDPEDDTSRPYEYTTKPRDATIYSNKEKALSDCAWCNQFTYNPDKPWVVYSINQEIKEETDG